MTPIHKTIQDRDQPDPLGLLPWMYSYDLGQLFVVERKKAGKIVRTESYKLVKPAGDDLRRWELIDLK